MKKRDKMKMIGVLILLLAIVTVIVTLVLVSRLSGTTGKDQKEETFDHSVSGILKNAYILKSEKKDIIVLYQGETYLAEGKPEKSYTGVADVELTKGKVTKIYAKPSTIQGVLTSYSSKSVQIEGYEPLDAEENLPVYLVASSGHAKIPVRQGVVSDLVIGNSKVDLVVADKKACALVSYQEDMVENVRVLIKNGKENTYAALYACCKEAYTIDGRKSKKNIIADAKKLLQGQKNGKEVRISAENGELLYRCDKDGNPCGFGYEGDLIFRKEKNGYVLLNELPIEDYVRYVLPSEMPLSFSYEALKAQAVCARTFTYGQMKGDTYAGYGANLDDTVAYQAYHATTSYEVTDQAVADTAGMVMTYNGNLADCYYYSTSPGYSENLEVWKGKSPGYLVAENHTREKTKDLSSDQAFHKFITAKADAYDENSPYFRWNATLSAKLGMDEKYGRLKKLKVNKRSSSGYVLSLTMIFEDGKRTIEKENEIRYALGKYLLDLDLSDGTNKHCAASVPSACFEIKSQKKGEIVLSGGGFGHGIGMSQYGADAMGKEGKNWQEILGFYFKDVTFTNVFDLDTQKETVVE